jgi:hypothetical protein
MILEAAIGCQKIPGNRQYRGGWKITAFNRIDCEVSMPLPPLAANDIQS